MIRTRAKRRGTSLLETVLACALLSAVLVPAMELMESGLVVSREVDTRNMLTTLCIAKLEEELAKTAASFTEASSSGTFAPAQSDLRYQVVRSFEADDADVSDTLMVLTATVWSDEDGDGSLDGDEPSCLMNTKVAKMTLYQSTFAEE